MSRGSLGGAFTNNISTEIGYDIVIEEARGRRIEENTQNQGDFALYSNTEWRPSDKLIIRPGVRLSYNTDYTAPLVPSIHIKYNYKKFILRSSFAKGFRAPSLKDLYFEFVDINHNIVGNPNLKAENSNNYQLSVDWKNIRNNYIIRGEMSFFYNDIHDLITLANTSDDAYSYINIGKYKTLGTKANINVTYEFIKFNAGVSYIGRQNDIDEVAPYSYALEWISNCTYEITKWNSNVAVYYKNTGALPSFWINADGEVLESAIDGYQIMDLTYSWSNPKNNLKVVVGCKNAFNIKNVNSISGSPGAHQSDASGMSVGYGRTFFTSLKWSLK
jgi:outer membrane receptor for ferrienterochelin and colicins